jgi:hypothetical protein
MDSSFGIQSNLNFFALSKSSFIKANRILILSEISFYYKILLVYFSPFLVSVLINCLFISVKLRLRISESVKLFPWLINRLLLRRLIQFRIQQISLSISKKSIKTQQSEKLLATSRRSCKLLTMELKKTSKLETCEAEESISKVVEKC